MKRFRAFASMFGVRHAIILAPMAGGTSTPTLAAAVSNAGGLGSFGAGYITPEEIAQSISAIHSLTDKPFAVNLFAGGDDGSVRSIHRDDGVDGPLPCPARIAPAHGT